jgi:hypothetical protein
MRNPFDNMREGITLRVVIGHEGGMPFPYHRVHFRP